MSNTADVKSGKPIAVWLQSISGANAINPLVAFYDIHTYHSRFIPVGVTEASQIFLRDALVLPKLFSYD
jgi:hypothetical protein